MRNRRIVYVMILAASVGLAVTYVERRQLQERYEAFQQSERDIEAAKRQIGELEHELSEEEARARNLVNDPVEVEAAIRRIKRGVRDGETVFRVEAGLEAPVDPAPTAEPSPEAPAPTPLPTAAAEGSPAPTTGAQP
jgi:cell division protein FtsB